MKTMTQELKFQGYDIKIENNGYGEVYMPVDIIKGVAYPFEKNSRLERHMVTFKTRGAAEKFLIRKGAKVLEA